MKKKDLEIITMMIEVIKESQKEIAEVKARAQKIEELFSRLEGHFLQGCLLHNLQWVSPQSLEVQPKTECNSKKQYNFSDFLPDAQECSPVRMSIEISFHPHHSCNNGTQRNGIECPKYHNDGGSVSHKKSEYPKRFPGMPPFWGRCQNDDNGYCNPIADRF